MGRAAPTGGRRTLASLQAEIERLHARHAGELEAAAQVPALSLLFDQFERNLLAAPSLSALIDSVLIDAPVLFDLDALTLTLVDPQHEVQQLLHGEVPSSFLPAGLTVLDDEQPLRAVFEGRATPLLCHATPAHAFLFPDTPELPPAQALLPLMHRGLYLGSLNLGSMEAQRFAADHLVDALHRLATLLAVCLHNALATERLALAGLTDALTGVHNRHYFEARCLEEAHAAQRRGPALPCLLIDVDHLRQINDSLGHPAGDEVLRRLAHLLTIQLRGYDVLARYGGGTFVLLLPATALPAAVSVAERICRSVAAQDMAVPGADAALHVTVSIGLSLLRASTQPGDFPQRIADMLERAARALYRAKEEGRDRVAVAAATDG